MLRLIVGVMLSLSCLPLATSEAQAAPSTTEAGPAEAEKQIDAFFKLLESGKSDEAVSAVIASSPLWSSRTGVKEQLLAQIDAGGKIYGPVSAHERISTERVGTMLVREYYFAQHRDMVTRWEFDFIRTPGGWKIGYFGFTDQLQSWFD